ncbi:flavin reductase family protein [Amycolatopsis pithecellobii]|uniref:Flavin reductase n=1 Tax=Amycolatopsis pithecellobii TaxID=664692 RepID=A0A6N7Z0S0_9PSEU|nr:flavin reductase family protein [Amycolatopsis pithecellobii]MTD54933.1 flavin reductase [Amycolatopsis pithecellobii]
MSQQADGPVTVVDPAGIRDVLGHFATGLTVITAIHEGVPVGFTCQAFSSLSLDPALVTFSVSRNSSSWPKVRQAPSLCVNVLSDDQADVSKAFGRSGADKFAGLAWRPSAHGAPLLDGVAAFVDARIWAEYDGGDHTIVAAAVLDLGADATRTPLIFHRGGYGLRAH